MTVYAVLTAVQSEEQGQPPPWPLLLPSANGCGHFIVQVSERHHKGALGGGGGGGDIGREGHTYSGPLSNGHFGN